MVAVPGKPRLPQRGTTCQPQLPLGPSQRDNDGCRHLSLLFIARAALCAGVSKPATFFLLLSTRDSLQLWVISPAAL